MVRVVHAAAPDAARLARCLAALLREHAYWTAPPKQARCCALCLCCGAAAATLTSAPLQPRAGLWEVRGCKSFCSPPSLCTRMHGAQAAAPVPAWPGSVGLGSCLGTRPSSGSRTATAPMLCCAGRSVGPGGTAVPPFTVLRRLGAAPARILQVRPGGHQGRCNTVLHLLFFAGHAGFAYAPEGRRTNALRKGDVEMGSPLMHREDVETAQAAGLDETGRRRLWREIASGAESGWDFSSRWLADGACGRSMEGVRPWGGRGWRGKIGCFILH